MDMQVQECYELRTCVLEAIQQCRAAGRRSDTWRLTEKLKAGKGEEDGETDPDAPVAAARELSSAQTKPEGSSLVAETKEATSIKHRGDIRRQKGAGDMESSLLEEGRSSCRVVNRMAFCCCC